LNEYGSDFLYFYKIESKQIYIVLP